MLTGQTIRSFGKGRDPFKVILEESPRSLKDYLSGCPKGLNNVMDRALAAKPEDRYANGREFLEAMRKVL
jgi:hypothetical protein